MQRGEEVRALILTPERELVTVRVGDYLGRDHGQITAIYSNRITLVERVQDGRGSWQEREQELTFSR